MAVSFIGGGNPEYMEKTTYKLYPIKLLKQKVTTFFSLECLMVSKFILSLLTYDRLTREKGIWIHIFLHLTVFPISLEYVFFCFVFFILLHLQDGAGTRRYSFCSDNIFNFHLSSCISITTSYQKQ